MLKRYDDTKSFRIQCASARLNFGTLLCVTFSGYQKYKVVP